MTTSAGAERVGLAVFDLEAKGDPRLAARFKDADIRTFSWLNDETLVFDVVDLNRGSGDRPSSPGLFSVTADGRDLRQLINPRRDFLAGMRLGRSPLHWNHALLAVPQGGGNDVIVGEWVGDAQGEVVEVKLLRVDVTDGSQVLPARGAPEHALVWYFDPTGEPRVARSRHAGRVRIHWRAPGQDHWKELGNFDGLRVGFEPHAVDAAGQLFVTVAEGSAGHTVLKRFDFATGAPEAKPLVSSPGFDFDGELVASDDGASAKTLGVRVLTDAETTVWIDERLKRVQQAADARLPGRANRLSCRRCSREDMVVLVYSWSDREPGEYWVYRPAADTWQSVGRVRTDIDASRMGTLDFHRIRARDGIELPVWITHPAGSDRKTRRPAVVLVHDGPWQRGVRWQWNADAQFLASRGYVVIEPEFRGSTGFGRRHYEAGWKQWGLAMQDDLADALAWAIGQGWVDRAKVCVAGGGYGGYAALMGLVRHPDLYRCGVAWSAVTDPRLLFEASSSRAMSAEVRLQRLPTLIGDPKVDAVTLASVAPVEQAARIKAPLLLAYGRDDTRVPGEHAARLRTALGASGNEPEWVLYADERQDWQKAETRVDFARRVDAFLTRHLK